jgi:hypothetical protein
MVDVAAGSARIDANGVSSPTKNPVRRNTAIAASSSSAGTPARSSASIEGETCTEVGVTLQKSGCTPQRSRSTSRRPLFQRHCAKMPSPPE